MLVLLISISFVPQAHAFNPLETITTGIDSVMDLYEGMFVQDSEDVEETGGNYEDHSLSDVWPGVSEYEIERYNLFPEYTYEDLSCDLVDLTDAYGNDSYSKLDRFWRTQSECCGPARIESDIDLFEDSIAWIKYENIRRSCWNNRGVSHDSTIAQVPEGREYWTEGDTHFNLLRLDTNPFRIEGEYDLYNLNYSASDTDKKNPTSLIFDSDYSTVNLYSGETNEISDSEYYKVELRSKHPIDMIGGLEYIIVLQGESSIGEIVDIGIDLVEGNSKNIEITRGLPTHLRNEIQPSLLYDDAEETFFALVTVPDTSKAIFELNITNDLSERSSLTMNRIFMVPRPLVLNHEGRFKACVAKDVNDNNTLADVEDSKTDQDIFNGDSLTKHCEVKVGTHVCTPEGTWVGVEDQNIPSSSSERRTEDQLEFTHLSTSPNIIEDSDFRREDPLGTGSGCKIEESDGPLPEVEDDHEAQRPVEIGKRFLACDDVDETVSIRDSDNTDLEDEDGYIFSAWVSSSGTISFIENGEVEDRVDISDSGWRRIEVSGNASSDGNVHIKLEGDVRIDAVQLEPIHESQIERGNYFPTVTRRSCCPDNACWNGEECVYMDADHRGQNDYRDVQHSLLDNPGFETNMGERGYLCVGGGNYEFREKSYRWIHQTPYDFDRETFNEFVASGEFSPSVLTDPSTSMDGHEPEHGFCPPDNCFVGTSIDPIEDDTSFTNIDRASCVEGATSYSELNRSYGRYCMNGEWKRKTHMVASMLLDIPDRGEDVSLYCGDYQHVLNYYDYSFDGDESTYYNIFGQSLFSLINHPETMDIDYLDKACILKYGSGFSNNVVALPLNSNATGTWAEFNNDDSEEYISPLAYFGLDERLSGECSDAVGSDDDEFIQCRGGTFYNPRHEIIIHSHNNRNFEDISSMSLLPSSKLPSSKNISSRIDLLKDEIKNHLYSSETESIFSVNESTQEIYEMKKWSLMNHDNYDDIFIFDSSEKEMVISREKILDTKAVDDNNFNYLVMAYLKGFEVNDTFNETYPPVFSPVEHNRSVNVVDIFNVTPKSVAWDDGDSVYMLSSTRYGQSDFYRYWYTFSGRLRGKLALPPQ